MRYQQTFQNGVAFVMGDFFDWFTGDVQKNGYVEKRLGGREFNRAGLHAELNTFFSGDEIDRMWNQIADTHDHIDIDRADVNGDNLVVLFKGKPNLVSMMDVVSFDERAGLVKMLRPEDDKKMGVVRTNLTVDDAFKNQIFLQAFHLFQDRRDKFVLNGDKVDLWEMILCEEFFHNDVKRDACLAQAESIIRTGLDQKRTEDERDFVSRKLAEEQLHADRLQKSHMKLAADKRQIEAAKSQVEQDLSSEVSAHQQTTQERDDAIAESKDNALAYEVSHVIGTIEASFKDEIQSADEFWDRLCQLVERTPDLYPEFASKITDATGRDEMKQVCRFEIDEAMSRHNRRVAERRTVEQERDDLSQQKAHVESERDDAHKAFGEAWGNLNVEESAHAQTRAELASEKNAHKKTKEEQHRQGAARTMAEANFSAEEDLRRKAEQQRDEANVVAEQASNRLFRERAEMKSHYEKQLAAKEDELRLAKETHNADVQGLEGEIEMLKRRLSTESQGRDTAERANEQLRRQQEILTRVHEGFQFFFYQFPMHVASGDWDAIGSEEFVNDVVLQYVENGLESDELRQEFELMRAHLSQDLLNKFGQAIDDIIANYHQIPAIIERSNHAREHQRFFTEVMPFFYELLSEEVVGAMEGVAGRSVTELVDEAIARLPQEVKEYVGSDERMAELRAELEAQVSSMLGKFQQSGQEMHGKLLEATKGKKSAEEVVEALTVQKQVMIILIGEITKYFESRKGKKIDEDALWNQVFGEISRQARTWDTERAWEFDDCFKRAIKGRMQAHVSLWIESFERGDSWKEEAEMFRRRFAEKQNELSEKEIALADFEAKQHRADLMHELRVMALDLMYSTAVTDIEPYTEDNLWSRVWSQMDNAIESRDDMDDLVDVFKEAAEDQGMRREVERALADFVGQTLALRHERDSQEAEMEGLYESHRVLEDELLGAQMEEYFMASALAIINKSENVFLDSQEVLSVAAKMVDTFMEDHEGIEGLSVNLSPVLLKTIDELVVAHNRLVKGRGMTANSEAVKQREQEEKIAMLENEIELLEQRLKAEEEGYKKKEEEMKALHQLQMEAKKKELQGLAEEDKRQALLELGRQHKKEMKAFKQKNTELIGTLVKEIQDLNAEADDLEEEA